MIKNVGFPHIKIKNSFENDIPNWNLYELDAKRGWHIPRYCCLLKQLNDSTQQQMS